MSTLFISDLHLSPCRPEITDCFLTFLQDSADRAEALYILGDLFEAWIGDDAADPEQHAVVAALKRFTATGLPCYFTHGNRDFLIGKRFSIDSGVQLLDETNVIELYGERVLLLHGDTLCTDDRRYQRFRRIVRNPWLHALYFAIPIAARRAIVSRIRKSSATEMALKPEQITDVNQHAVAATMRRFGVQKLVHGHTHRPAVHHFTLDQQPACRIVLGDWYTQGSFLECGPDGFKLQSLPLRDNSA
jgi:UDP-2,3-diacylglucosamine hydrolase